ncbi:hypothetical protein K466DRAFT_162068 [Polyporus arcularius HHB13444]|uniref:Uncharacterized protein n=1 Tax=Polyporus arcularius HHB13444 TaxID=1314778 RepID=A0A5C3PA32_9APHY|nr:hypothetical protein K466DRAFT_162068 [Polyporus arcularius HHB13444]
MSRWGRYASQSPSPGSLAAGEEGTHLAPGGVVPSSQQSAARPMSSLGRSGAGSGVTNLHVTDAHAGLATTLRADQPPNIPWLAAWGAPAAFCVRKASGAPHHDTTRPGPTAARPLQPPAKAVGRAWARVVARPLCLGRPPSRPLALTCVEGALGMRRD